MAPILELLTLSSSSLMRCECRRDLSDASLLLGNLTGYGLTLVSAEPTLLLVAYTSYV
jgi:hypothetical protein